MPKIYGARHTRHHSSRPPPKARLRESPPKLRSYTKILAPTATVTYVAPKPPKVNPEIHQLQSAGHRCTRPLRAAFQRSCRALRASSAPSTRLPLALDTRPGALGPVTGWPRPLSSRLGAGPSCLPGVSPPPSTPQRHLSRPGPRPSALPHSLGYQVLVHPPTISSAPRRPQ